MGEKCGQSSRTRAALVSEGQGAWGMEQTSNARELSVNSYLLIGRSEAAR
jgi:hypothetical protein